MCFKVMKRPVNYFFGIEVACCTKENKHILYPYIVSEGHILPQREHTYVSEGKHLLYQKEHAYVRNTHIVPRGNTLILPRGNAHIVPEGTHICTRGNTLILPRGNAHIVPEGTHICTQREHTYCTRGNTPILPEGTHLFYPERTHINFTPYHYSIINFVSQHLFCDRLINYPCVELCCHHTK